MIARIRSWWAHLGYSNGKWNDDGTIRTWGIRPWRGAPFLWFIVDYSCTAVQSDNHVESCEECRAKGVPTPRTRRKPFHHVCTDGLAIETEDGPYCGACEAVPSNSEDGGTK